jgi:hypothetical protein
LILEAPEKLDVYQLGNELNKGEDNLLSYLAETLKVEGIDYVLRILKASGVTIDIFNSKKNDALLCEIFELLFAEVKEKDKHKISSLQRDIHNFEKLFQGFARDRDGFFEKYESIDDKYKTAAYLISLELVLNLLDQKEKLEEKNGKSLTFLSKNIIDDLNTRTNIFEATIASSGMILNFLKFRGYKLSGLKKNFKAEDINVASFHILLSEIWDILNEILEYWNHSDVKIEFEENYSSIDIIDHEFELNNLISNERFNNLREGWQLSKVMEINSMHGADDGKRDFLLKESLSNLNYLFAVLYFGSPLLDAKVRGIELLDWIRAYEIIVEESKKFRLRKQDLSTINVSKICFVKPVSKWEKIFRDQGFSKKEIQIIIKTFTFDSTSNDLIDCPFIKAGEDLILIPTLTSHADASRALGSNFLNRKLDLSFKGPEFEERIKVLLSDNNIINSSLYKKNASEYQCDVAFILNDELFLVECKAHVQPFTTKQHSNHLHKLHKDAIQLNRIADFFEENINIVNEQLNLSNDFKPKKVHRIVLTTSMIGAALQFKGVYIIDESSFTMFITRQRPSFKHYEKGRKLEVPNQQYENIYEGDVTAEKLMKFLNSPPQIELVRELFARKEIKLDGLNISRHMKVNNTLHVGIGTKDMKLDNLNKFFNKPE